METATRTRPVLRPLVVLFYAASVLVLIAAWQLFVLTDHTDRFFAWTIGVPLTAAVDGAFYLAAFVLLFPATRARTWVEVKPLSFGVLCISTLKLVATLLHVDLFHFTEGPATARFAAWGWLAVYVLVPIALVVLIAAELRSDGTDPPPTQPMSPGLCWVTGLLAAGLVLIGAGMLLAPATMSAHWPWPLTPLTSQALSAWFVGIGVLAILVVQGGDVVRARNLWTASLVLPPLQAIALIRYGDAVDWGSFAAWAYVAVFALIGAIGVWGTVSWRIAATATPRPARS